MKNAYLKYIFSMVLFGLNGVVASNISLSSYEIVFFRTLIGSLTLLLLFLFSKHRFTFMENKKDLVYIGISGMAMGTSWMFLYEAYVQMGVGIGSLLYYTGPVILMILSPVMFDEKLTVPKITGFIAVLIGIFLINGNIFEEDVNTFGIFCGLMAAVMYFVMVASNKKSSVIKGMENPLIQLITAFITVAIFVGFKSGYGFQFEGSDWFWIILLGILNTGIGCYLFFSSIGYLPVQSVAILGYLEPILAVIFSVILLNEIMTPIQSVGAILVVGGAVFGESVKSGRGKAD